MTIKQQGGVFGRNPKFNDLKVDNDLFVDGSLGVGTDTPTGLFEVSGSGFTTARFTRSNGLSTSNIIEFANDVDGITGQIGGIAGGGVLVRSGTTEVFRTDNSGNIVFPSGQGIDFSATAGTGTSELFDDYEEGEFGVTITPKTSGTITLNSSFNNLAYTKIGRVVTVTGMAIVSSVASPVGTDFTVDGLPFVIADLGEAAGRFGGAIAFNDLATITADPIRGFEGGTTITVARDASTVGASDQLYIQFSYMTS